MPEATSLQRVFDASPMSPTQIRVVVLTAVLSALDGYDVLSVTFAAPAILKQWDLGLDALGVVLSAGLFGMAAGSFLLGPLADKTGRRLLVLISLALMAVGMLMAALATSVPWLAFWRVVTGLGIGTCVTVINPLAAEFSNARRRSLAIALMAMGYPIGGVLGGVLSAVLLRSMGWESIFIVGFVVAVLLIPVALLILPESPMFLAQRQPSNALDRLNSVLDRCKKPRCIALPPRALRSTIGYRALFTADRLTTTVALAVANVLYAAAAYYVLSWLPQMVADAGFNPSDGSIASATASVVGVIGGIALGWLAARYSALMLTVGCTVGLASALLVFGMVPANWGALLGAAAVLGLFLYAGVSGFYFTLAQSFDSSVRATGVGFVMGWGRVASAVAPLLAGWLFATGAERGTVSVIFAASSLMAGLVLTLTFRKGPGLGTSGLASS
ncbi:MFS transporter [Sphingomonas sp. SUN039]|uniref:MFS transporter n=1 Tax=Sphingomonas sp. SUN039 TaxID=2937787 RepID=UPI002164E233|nr:MFS transporter [Sphingomonas sp. SUN039]UVO53767.1 MFS transporter [Sphingomonas sp. SUN039]